MATIPGTVTEQINDAKSLEISYRTLHPSVIVIDKETNRVIRVPFSSIISKYKNYLSRIIISYKLNEKEQIKYAYKPKAFSEDIYGTTELWDTLLILNNCKSVMDFTPKTIKMYDPREFKSYLNEILIIEEELGNLTY